MSLLTSERSKLKFNVKTTVGLLQFFQSTIVGLMYTDDDDDDDVC